MKAQSVTGYTWAKALKTAQLRSELTKPRANKFNARKVTLDGIQFDSVAESRFYAALKLREKAGEIAKLRCHPTYEIRVNGAVICTYKPDFDFVEIRENRVRVVDVKSPPTAKKRDFVLIRKLFEATYKMPLEVVT